jgi:hypothetical protein
MSTTPDEQEILRQRHERKMQLQRERRQRQREARERPGKCIFSANNSRILETTRETGIEKQLRLIAENSIKQEKVEPGTELLDEENVEGDDSNDQEDVINGMWFFG